MNVWLQSIRCLLCHTILSYNTTLYYTAWHYTPLYYSPRHTIVSHHTALHHTALRCCTTPHHLLHEETLSHPQRTAPLIYSRHTILPHLSSPHILRFDLHCDRFRLLCNAARNGLRPLSQLECKHNRIVILTHQTSNAKRTINAPSSHKFIVICTRISKFEQLLHCCQS